MRYWKRFLPVTRGSVNRLYWSTSEEITAIRRLVTEANAELGDRVREERALTNSAVGRTEVVVRLLAENVALTERVVALQRELDRQRENMAVIRKDVGLLMSILRHVKTILAGE